jgi:hypothetical protein
MQNVIERIIRCAWNDHSPYALVGSVGDDSVADVSDGRRIDVGRRLLQGRLRKVSNNSEIVSMPGWPE